MRETPLLIFEKYAVLCRFSRALNMPSPAEWSAKGVTRK